MDKEIDAKEEPSVLEEFYDSLPKEGDEPKEEADKPDDSSPSKEKETPAVEGKSDDTTPFHKHPRWIKLQEEKRQQAEIIANFGKKFSDLEEKLGARDKDKVPTWFTERFGEDPKLWTAYRQTTQEEKADIKKEIMAEIRAEQAQESQRQAGLQTWVQDSIQELKDEGEKFDENALLKILTDYSPTDAQGNIDFKKGLAILRQLDSAKGDKEKEKSTARKEVAASTTSSSKGEKTAQVLTAKQLRKKSFHDLVS